MTMAAATPVGTVKAGADGTFSFTTSSALSDKVVHRFTATVTDNTRAIYFELDCCPGHDRRQPAVEHVGQRPVPRQWRS